MILKNKKRIGVNACYNKGVNEAKYDYVLTSDADVAIHEEALKRAVKILIQLEDVGGVTARMITVSRNITEATRIEDAYRNIFDNMMIAESAIFSTFPGYTCFALFKKAVFSKIACEQGSSDGNISLTIIKNGFRFILVPYLLFYEPISHKIKEQKKQKIRRASRLTQSILMNRDMFFNKNYRDFGRLIFPLRYLMQTACPVLIFLTILSMIVWTYSISWIITLISIISNCAIIFFGLKTNIKIFSLFASFFIHQTYLFLGFIFSFRKHHIWTVVERGTIN